MSVPTGHPIPEYPKMINERKVYTRSQEDAILDEQKAKAVVPKSPEPVEQLPSAADLDAVAAEDEAKKATE